MNDGCQTDTAIQILKYIFDEAFIESYLTSGSMPATVQLSGEKIMPLIINQVSQVALSVTLVILVFYWIFAFLSSAGDGQIKGLAQRDSSFLGSYGRPIFSCLMLFPTLSGYSIISVIVMWIVVMSNGIANSTFVKLADNQMTVSTLVGDNATKNLKIANSMIDPVFYGAMHGYCSLSAQTYIGTSDIRLNSNHGESGSSSVYEFSVEDTKPNGKVGRSGIPGSICGDGKIVYRDFSLLTTDFELPGNFLQEILNGGIDNNDGNLARVKWDIVNFRAAASLYVYQQGYQYSSGGRFASVKAELDSQIDQIEQKITNAHFKNAMASIKSEGGRISGSGWQVVSMQPVDAQQGDVEVEGAYDPDKMIDFAVAVNNHLTNAMNQYLRDLRITGKMSEEDVKMLKEFEKSVYARGWMGAGIGRAKMASARRSIYESLYANDNSFGMNLLSPPSEKEDDENREWSNHLSSLRGVFASVQGDLSERRNRLDGKSSQDHLVNSSFLRESVMVTEQNISAKNAAARYFDGNSFIEGLRNMEASVVSTITGAQENGTAGEIDFSKSNGDMLVRIQETGEMIAARGVIISSIRVGLDMLAAATESSGESLVAKVSGVISVAAGTLVAVLNGIVAFLATVSEVLNKVATMMAVIIPSLPYISLTVAGIGWIMQIVMTLLAMQLFMIMHALPSNGFLGSQQQGWVALLVLFVRPLLIVVGFFAAFALYEPLVTYLTNAFFALRGNTGAYSSDLIGIAAWFSTFTAFWYMYAGTLVVVTYLVFSMPQEIGDEIGGWLGTGLHRTFGNINSSRLFGGASAGAMAGAALAGAGAKAAAAAYGKTQDKLADQRQKAAEAEKEKEDGLADKQSKEASKAVNAFSEPPADSSQAGKWSKLSDSMKKAGASLKGAAALGAKSMGIDVNGPESKKGADSSNSGSIGSGSGGASTLDANGVVLGNDTNTSTGTDEQGKNQLDTGSSTTDNNSLGELDGQDHGHGVNPDVSETANANADEQNQVDGNSPVNANEATSTGDMGGSLAKQTNPKAESSATAKAGANALQKASGIVDKNNAGSAVAKTAVGTTAATKAMQVLAHGNGALELKPDAGVAVGKTEEGKTVSSAAPAIPTTHGSGSESEVAGTTLAQDGNSDNTISNSSSAVTGTGQDGNLVSDTPAHANANGQNSLSSQGGKTALASGVGSNSNVNANQAPVGAGTTPYTQVQSTNNTSTASTVGDGAPAVGGTPTTKQNQATTATADKTGGVGASNQQNKGLVRTTDGSTQTNSAPSASATVQTSNGMFVPASAQNVQTGTMDDGSKVAQYNVPTTFTTPDGQKMEGIATVQNIAAPDGSQVHVATMQDVNGAPMTQVTSFNTDGSFTTTTSGATALGHEFTATQSYASNGSFVGSSETVNTSGGSNTIDMQPTTGGGMQYVATATNHATGVTSTTVTNANSNGSITAQQYTDTHAATGQVLKNVQNSLTGQGSYVATVQTIGTAPKTTVHSGNLGQATNAAGVVNYGYHTNAQRGTNTTMTQVIKQPDVKSSGFTVNQQAVANTVSKDTPGNVVMAGQGDSDTVIDDKDKKDGK